jgi:hypothetical protein
VQRAVELAVAAAVESVALVFAGAGVERGDAGVAGQLSIRVEAVDRADFAEQFGVVRISGCGAARLCSHLGIPICRWNRVLTPHTDDAEKLRG